MWRSWACLLFVLPAVAPAAGDAVPPLQDPVAEYQRRAQAVPACSAGEAVMLPVTAEPPVEAGYDATTGRLHIHYGMFFNDLTEGWNWHPLDAVAGGDYYAFKFLPLTSRLEEGADYAVDNGPGYPDRYAVRTRTDYFFAFDNPYDFYSRDAGDAMGFDADVVLSPEEAGRVVRDGLRLAVLGRLAADCLSGSKTYWRATVARPVDYTLLKRYLIGRIEEIWFFDSTFSMVLVRRPASASSAGQPASLTITR
jgi:hypothetical protein